VVERRGAGVASLHISCSRKVLIPCSSAGCPPPCGCAVASSLSSRLYKVLFISRSFQGLLALSVAGEKSAADEPFFLLVALAIPWSVWRRVGLDIELRLGLDLDQARQCHQRSGDPSSRS
jgi:hypothetical protein